MPGLGVTTTTNLFLFFSRIIGHSNVIPSRREKEKSHCILFGELSVRRTTNTSSSLLSSHFFFPVGVRSRGGGENGG